MARKRRENKEEIAVVHELPPQQTYYVGAYIRLSAVDRKQKGDSIETQQAIISAFVEEHHDLELAGVYIDDGVSGQVFERPAFMRMIADMESGKINCCVTKDLSRLGRNAIDAGFYVEKYFPTKGIRFIAITDDYDSNDPNCNGFMLSMRNIFNELNATETGKKISQTKQMNIRKGLFVGRVAPYGYLKSKRDKHLLEPDPYAAPIVLKMFGMVAGGQSVSDIARWLNSSSILPPKRYLHSKGLASAKESGGHIHWNKGSIYAVLKNRVYCGDMIQGKFRCKSYVQTTQSKSDWIVVEDTHEAIVSRELFEAVQKLWPGTTRPSKQKNETTFTDILSAIRSLPGVDGGNHSRNSTSGNIFLRKVFCGHCGYTLRRARSGKIKHQFKCETRQMYDKGDCVLVSIGEDILKEILLDELNKQAEVLGDSQKIVPAASAEQNPDRNEIKKLQSEIKRSSNFLQGLYESRSNGDITSEEFKSMKVSYESKIADLSAREKELRNEMFTRAAREAEESKTAAHLQGVRQISNLTTDVLDRLVKKIAVYEDKLVEVHFTFTDEITRIHADTGHLSDSTPLFTHAVGEVANL